MAKEDSIENLAKRVNRLEVVVLFLALSIAVLVITLWPLTCKTVLFLFLAVCFIAICYAFYWQCNRMTKRTAIQWQLDWTKEGTAVQV